MLQIDSELNYYGTSDVLVPSLRYATKEAASCYVTAAKSAQKDFILYTGKIEDTIKQSIQSGLFAVNLLKKANLQMQVSDEQANIAATNVQLAQKQITQIQAAIKVKQDEIKENDGFFNQLKDFCEGMGDSLTDLSGLASMAVGGAMGAYAKSVQAGYTTMSSMNDKANSLKGISHFEFFT